MGSRGAIVTLALLLFLAPGTQVAHFDGFPFSGGPEFVAVLIFLVVLFSGRRTGRTGPNDRSRDSIRLVAPIVLLLVVLLKVSLYWWQPTAGVFESCHRHFDEPSLGESCLPTFDNTPGLPFRSEHFDRRSSVTPVVDFGQMSDDAAGISFSNWGLGFVNSKKYDDGYFPWEPDDLNIEYFPFAVEFAGIVSGYDHESIDITYVGEGVITFGNLTYQLEPSYSTVKTLSIDLPAETSLLRLDFRYAQTVTNSAKYDGPYATLKMTDNDGKPVRANESTGFRALRLLPDLTILVLLGAWLWRFRRKMGVTTVVAPVATVALASFVDERTSMGSILPIPLSALILGLLLVQYLRRRRVGILGLLVSGFVVSYQLVRTEFEFVAKHLVSLDYVFPRLRGNDHLVYQAFTQEMLESGFFRGAESVFYFQPGIRYVYYVGHWLFGSGDVIPGIVVLFGTFASIVFLVHTVRELATIRVAPVAIGIFGLIIWWSSSHTVQTTIFGLSESGTWPLLIILAGIYARRRLSVASAVLVGVMLGAIVWIRPNQGIAALAWLLCFVALSRRLSDGSRRAALVITSFASTLLLVPIHNVVYGNTLSFLPGGRMFTEHYGWTTIFEAFTDDTARRFILEQTKGILYLPSVLPDLYSRQLALAFVLFFLTWATGMLRLVRRETLTLREGLLLNLLIVGQIAPFLNYSVYRYFPVHIISIHLSVVLVGVLLLVEPKAPTVEESRGIDDECRTVVT